MNADNQVKPFSAAVLPDGNGGFVPCPVLLTEEEAVRYLRVRLDGGSQPLSAWSRSRLLRNARTIFNKAVEWGLIDRNPFSGKRTVRLRDKGIDALAYCCGLRLGEILSLTWAENIRVVRTVQDGTASLVGEMVRKLAGHSDIKTTMQYYSKVTEEQRRKAAEVTDRLLEMGLASGATGTYAG